MKILFQTIGVLVQYNWALPYHMVKGGEAKVVCLANAFSYAMGGHYYHLKAPRGLNPLLITTGAAQGQRFDKIVEKSFPIAQLSAKFDVVHLNSPGSPLTRRALRGGAPKVFVLHSSLDVMDEERARPALRELEEIYAGVNAFVVASNHAAKTVEKWLNFKPLVIHHGIDTSIFNPYNVSKQEARKKLSIPCERKIVLWVGRISPEKNLLMAVKALEHIVREDQNALLLVKGRAVSEPYLKRVLDLARKLNVAKHLVLDVKWSTNMMMYYYYRAADVYVHTSLTEAFGSLTLLEAMASGTPVIANNASSIPEAVGDAGFLANSEEELAERVLEVLHNDRLRKELSERGSRRVLKNFTLEIAAEKYLRLYREVISSGHSK